MSTWASRNPIICGRYGLRRVVSDTPQVKYCLLRDDEGRSYTAKLTKVDQRGNSSAAFQKEHQVFAALTTKRIRIGQASKRTTPPGLPNLYFVGRHRNEYDVIVTTSLYDDLFSLMHSNNATVHLNTNYWLRTACNMLKSLKSLHQHGFVHRNVNPHNFHINSGWSLYLVDFTNAKSYCDPLTGAHYPKRQETFFTGSLKYGSINAQHLKTHSRRDDLISLGYSVIFLIKKSLPWEDYCDDDLVISLFRRMNDVARMKETFSLQRLCSGLQTGVLEYMRTVTTMSYDATPDYERLRALLHP